MASTIDNILIVRFSSVGDVLLSTLLLRVFRKRFPQCRLDYLIKEEYAELLRYNPNVNNVIPFPSAAGIEELRKVRRNVRAAGYDLIIDIHDSLRSRFICAGHVNVVRVDKRKLSRWLLVKAGFNLYRFFGRSQPVPLRYLEPVAEMGIEDDGEGLDFPLPEGAVERAREGINGDRLIGVAPGALHATKRWPVERFAETALELARHTGEGILILGSSDDRIRGTEIENYVRARGPNPVYNMAGKTTLTEAAALMDLCSLILVNDSGLMHLAAARKRKIVAVFGSTVEELGFYPFRTESIVLEQDGLRCRPCSHIGRDACPKRHFRCMLDTAPDEAVRSGLRLLGKSS